MKVYILADELDDLLLKYLYAFHSNNTITICGKLLETKFATALSNFDVKFTDNNDIYLKNTVMKDFSDGIILSANDVKDVASGILKKDLISYKFKIQNIITGDILDSCILIESYSHIQDELVQIYSSRNVCELLRLNNTNIKKLLLRDIELVSLRKSNSSDRVLFNIIDDNLVPKGRGFSEGNNEFKHSVELDGESFSRFDRRFLRGTIMPIQSISIESKSIPTLKFCDSFPYNLFLDCASICIPSMDGEFEIIVKDYIYKCIKTQKCGVIYLSSDNVIVYDYIIQLGYPKNLVKNWSFDYE